MLLQVYHTPPAFMSPKKPPRKTWIHKALPIPLQAAPQSPRAASRRSAFRSAWCRTRPSSRNRPLRIGRPSVQAQRHRSPFPQKGRRLPAPPSLLFC